GPRWPSRTGTPAPTSPRRDPLRDRRTRLPETGRAIVPAPIRAAAAGARTAPGRPYARPAARAPAPARGRKTRPHPGPASGRSAAAPRPAPRVLSPDGPEAREFA